MTPTQIQEAARDIAKRFIVTFFPKDEARIGMLVEPIAAILSRYSEPEPRAVIIEKGIEYSGSYVFGEKSGALKPEFISEEQAKTRAINRLQELNTERNFILHAFPEFVGNYDAFERPVGLAGEEADDEPVCNHSGRCTPPYSATGVSNCIHCGKELHEKDGKWFTWDADLHPAQAVQAYSSGIEERAREFIIKHFPELAIKSSANRAMRVAAAFAQQETAQLAAKLQTAEAQYQEARDLAIKLAGRIVDTEAERDQIKKHHDNTKAFLLEIRAMLGAPPSSSHAIDHCIVIQAAIRKIEAERDQAKSELQEWRTLDPSLALAKAANNLQREIECRAANQDSVRRLTEKLETIQRETILKCAKEMCNECACGRKPIHRFVWTHGGLATCNAGPLWQLLEQASKAGPPIDPTICQANRDGECTWESCPQSRDDEPDRSGRHCPLDIEIRPEDDGGLNHEGLQRKRPSSSSKVCRLSELQGHCRPAVSIDPPSD